MPVNETAGLEQALTEEVDASVDRIFCNALYPERFSAEQLELLEPLADGNGIAVAAASRAAVRVAGRARAQREQLARLAEMTSAPLTTVPFVFEPEMRIESLRHLAAEVTRT
jgi:hypothetical protein